MSGYAHSLFTTLRTLEGQLILQDERIYIVLRLYIYLVLGRIPSGTCSKVFKKLFSLADKDYNSLLTPHSRPTTLTKVGAACVAGRAGYSVSMWG